MTKTSALLEFLRWNRVYPPLVVREEKPDEVLEENKKLVAKYAKLLNAGKTERMKP